MELTKDYLDWTAEACMQIDDEPIEQMIQLLMDARRSGNRIFIIGNGGSAATASHFCEDLGKCTLSSLEDAERFKVISLTDNLPYVTAWANDNGYDVVFEQQLRNLGESGDLVFAISASGKSPNVVKALQYAKQSQMKIAGMTGFSGGAVKDLSDCCVHVEIPVKSNSAWHVRSSTADYGMIENMHMIVVHLIIATIVQRLNH
jgi:D-sedoheptulose 7-phosphate isomerase